MSRVESVRVVADLENLPEPATMGQLYCQRSGRGEVLSFEYAHAWLQHREAFTFDPDLALVTGAQYPAAGRSSFGIFLDSAPDRWGRVLMQRRENQLARQERRRPRVLTDWDFLLGVHDEARMGALRFCDDGGVFFATDAHFAVPPITSLPELQAASLQFEQHIDDEDHPDYSRWLAQLLAPGSSLGGARPKASVRDQEGHLCLAKFPSRRDTRDIGGWELVANRLAAKAGIEVPSTRPLRLHGGAHTTFLARRFDRAPNGRRRAFVSAMTLTQRVDGEPGASYLELVALLQERGSKTQADCAQLFRRVVFNILIHNTDDHLRNHGFFLDSAGIRLAPAYDLNPSVERHELSLAINEVETACDLSVAMAGAKDYGLTPRKAEAIITEVRNAISRWQDEAAHLGIPRSEQDAMAPAFAMV